MDFLNKHPMEMERQDGEDILKNPEIVDESTDSNGDDGSDDGQDYYNLKAELDKVKTDYHNQKIRAEKAEGKLKSTSTTGKGETSKYDNLSPFDLIAVTKANLDEDSLKEAMDYAKYKRISIAEAIKSPAVRATIQILEENKKVAEATSTGTARRGISKVSDDVLLYNSQKGGMPDSEEDWDRLIKLRAKTRK